MVDHIAALSRVYRVVCIANCSDTAWLRQRGIEVPLVDVRIERAPSPIRDLQAIWTLYRYFKKYPFDAVHSVTPKAGLLAMIAAALARVPVRIHTFTGQVWASRSGVQRIILKALDACTAAMATHILVDGQAQLEFLLREGVVSADKSLVLGRGSMSGVDIERFRPDTELREKMRVRHGLPASSVVFLHLGRLKRDKGVMDLARAFSIFARTNEDAYLCIVGPDEDNLEANIQQVCGDCISRVRLHGYTDNPEQWMAACDVLCLPSYREGFSSVIIDAASTGVPAIGSRIYGITDAIEEGVTGLLHNPGKVDEIVDKMRIMAQNEELRISLGHAARVRSHRYFTKEIVTEELSKFYSDTL
jgi:glycosyltransferase involved in cell wall biosynthesis